MLADNRDPEEGHLAKNILWLYALQGMNYLIPVILLPYLVRVLGVGQYGLVAFSQAIAQYFIIGTDYGFNFSATKEIALHRHDPAEVSRIFYGVMAIKMVLVAIGAALMVGAIAFVPRLRADGAIYGAAYVAVIGSALFPVWLFQGMERMRFISIITGASKLVAAGLIFLLVHGPQDTFRATLLQSAGFLIAGLIGLGISIKYYAYKMQFPRRQELLLILTEGRHVFLSTASITLYTNTNTFLVGVIAGNVQAGYFSLADKLIRAVTALIFPFLQAGYPHIVRLIKESRERALLFFRRTVSWGLAAGLVVGLLLFVFAGPIATLAVSRSAVGVVPVLRVVSLFPALAVVTASMGMLIYIPFGLEKIYSRLLLAVGVANVVLCFFLIPLVGAVGAALAMMLMESLQMICGWYLLQRNGVDLLSFHRSTGDIGILPEESKIAR
jgi:PST family polysaccharide transporter